MDNSILVIDDERDFLESVRRGLITSGIKNVRIAEDPRKAAAAFEAGEEFDIALIDITMPKMDGVELLEIIKNTSPSTECIMVTAVDEALVAINCLKKGAYDYLVKPISKENLVSTIRRALERRRLIEILDVRKRPTLPRLDNEKAFRPIITRTAEMIRILKEAELHAASDIPVLITGETGTGKELLAKAIHAASLRSAKTFTPVNMESLNLQLFESQFLGRSPGPPATVWVIWKAPIGVRCSWTKSATCPLKCRASCCGFCRTVNSSRSAHRRHAKWTSGLLPPPMPTWAG